MRQYVGGGTRGAEESFRKVLNKFSLKWNIKYRLLMLLFFLGGIFSLSAQVEVEGFGGVINLDSITVTASRAGFDVADFVDLVRKDKSFYQAFTNLRHHSYKFSNHIEVLDKKNLVAASYDSRARQTSDGDCRSMEEWDLEVTGKFFKNEKKRKHKYYTAKLYDRLFFTKDTVCESVRVYEGDGDPKQEGHIDKLKQLVFSPGEKINVPIIGKKMEIFEPEMAKYYDYEINSVTYQDSQPAYVFSAKVKPAFQNYKKDKTVIKSLETYFDKENFQVLARDYQLQYSGLLFDFDVTMRIELKQVNGNYVPAFLSYDGDWKVAVKKRERVRFWMKVD